MDLRLSYDFLGLPRTSLDFLGQGTKIIQVLRSVVLQRAEGSRRLGLGRRLAWLWLAQAGLGFGWILVDLNRILARRWVGFGWTAASTRIR